MKVKIYYRLASGYVDSIKKNLQRKTLERILANFYAESDDYRSKIDNEKEFIKLKMEEISKYNDGQLIDEINKWYVRSTAEFPEFATFILIDLLD